MPIAVIMPSRSMRGWGIVRACWQMASILFLVIAQADAVAAVMLVVPLYGLNLFFQPGDLPCAIELLYSS